MWTAPQCELTSTQPVQKGGFSTKVHVKAEGKGKLMALVLTPGQRYEDPFFPHLMEGGSGRTTGSGAAASCAGDPAALSQGTFVQDILGVHLGQPERLSLFPHPVGRVEGLVLFLWSSHRWRLRMCLTVPSGSPRAWEMHLLPLPLCGRCPAFALLVGELVSFSECEAQQGGIPPFMAVCVNSRIGGMPHFFRNSSNTGVGGRSPSLGAFTRDSFPQEGLAL